MLGFENEAALLAAATALGAEEQQQAPIFLPYLSGERSPHNNPLASGAWTGLRAQHGREHLAYAVAEGVGFGLLDGLLHHPAHRSARCTRSLWWAAARAAPGWAQLLADIFGLAAHRATRTPKPAVPWVRRAWPGWPPAVRPGRGVHHPAGGASRFTPDAARGAWPCASGMCAFSALYPALQTAGA